MNILLMFLFPSLFVGCYVIIYQILKHYGITHKDRGWWIIMISVLVIRVMAMVQGSLK